MAEVKPATDQLIAALVGCARVNYEEGIYSESKYREVLSIKSRVDAEKARADAAEQRVAELEAEIAKLRGREDWGIHSHP